MSSPMNTDLDAQSASQGRVGGLVEEGQTTISEMISCVDQLKALWKGEGAQAFQIGSNDLQQQFEKGKVALQDVADKMGHNNTGYSNADSTNASSLANVGL
ncbi:WXG100 family type VII secretion target [Mycobacteroides abscessus]|nr:WXG100 family type VII secretion target [Mycobacteroides abscessus]MDM2412298.1 WXG100 family type VII secretion target [Mycobacteroides abscessus]